MRGNSWLALGQNLKLSRQKLFAIYSALQRESISEIYLELGFVCSSQYANKFVSGQYD